MNNKTLAIIVAIVLGSLVIRASYGWDLYLWLDEVQTVYNIEQGPGYLLSINLQDTITDVHPPLYPLLLWAWHKLFQSDFGLRLLSIFFSLLSILFLFAFVQQLSSRRTALLATLLSVFSVPHIHYATEVRMYSLTVLLALMNMFYLLKWQEKQSTYHTISYLLTACAALYTYHFLAFIFLAQWIYIVLTHFRNLPLLKNWLGLNLVLLLGYIPGLYRLTAQLGFVGHGYWGVQPHLLELPALFFWFVADSSWPLNRFFQILIASTWLLAFAVGWLTFRSGKIMKTMLSIWLFLPPLVIYALSFRSPLFQPRYFLFGIPVFYFFVSLGLQKIGETRFRWSFIPVFILTTALAIFFFWDYPLRLDMKSVVETIDHGGNSPLPVVHLDVCGGNYETYIVSRYYRTGTLPECILAKDKQIGKEVRSIIGPSDVCQSMTEVIGPNELCWLVYERSFVKDVDPIARLKLSLPENYEVLQSYHFYLVDLYLVGPGPAHPVTGTV